MQTEYEQTHPETDWYIDVRSELEYARGHISGAANLPILSDLERHEVGWLYKNAGSDEAKMRGAIYGAAKVERFVRTITARLPEIAGRGGQIVVYCARGGYRSRSVTALLNSIQVPVRQLVGGYKAYRQHVLSRLAGPFPRFIGINGLTGSGKTHILRHLRELGEPTLDLEGAANHKGSLLGAVGTDGIQCVQQFENDIVAQLDAHADARYCFVEMESRRIGKLSVPAALYAAYHDDPVQIEIARTQSERVSNLIIDYASIDPAVFDTQVGAAIERLKAYLTPETYRSVRAAFERKDHRELAGLLLEHHYDPLYRRSIGEPVYLESFRGPSNLDIATQVASWIRSSPPALSHLF